MHFLDTLRLFRRKAPAQQVSQYPLSLSAEEWHQLVDLVAQPGWAAFRGLLERYASLRAQRLLTPLTHDQTNIERGAVAALIEMAALPEQLISRWREIEREQQRRRDDALAAADIAAGNDFHWRWGSSLFADSFGAFGADRKGP